MLVAATRASFFGRRGRTRAFERFFKFDHISLSDADQALLERLDIDPERFREAAADICPSR